ncbi:gag/pol protein [Cucumis melo var. makuwa]|uniref:Gag/pol protein n=1 Tax=Cucumis melo var. makuwa TaxID=1194695 RepID=A0A5D3D689_CUCMM|nr:gag/pol protein [Cucumis melo var. makuwa]TYK19052.1 gag/pol protein [Cucumis melo var. makuwa]
MNSSIVQLLASEKLNGDKYAAWKSNLNGVDNLRFFLTEECPQTSASNANRTSQEAYDRWVKANEKARVYILASMTNVLAKKYESLATAKEIVDALRAIFGQPEWSLRHEAIKYIYTKRYLTDIKKWLATQFQMKDLGDAQYVLGIQIVRNHKNRTLAIYEIHLSKEQCPKTPQKVEDMRKILYASAVESLVYAMLCTRPDICFSVGMKKKDYMLVYGTKDLILTGYTDFDIQTDKDARKSTSGSIFTLNEGAVVWRSVKQTCIADSIIEAEYVAACELAKEAVWLRKFLTNLEIDPNMHLPITLYSDNSVAVAN